MNSPPPTEMNMDLQEDIVSDQVYDTNNRFSLAIFTTIFSKSLTNFYHMFNSIFV